MVFPTGISCISTEWRGEVVQTLTEVKEVDLIHFLFGSDLQFCEEVASQYSMDFTAKPEERVAFFRKRTPALSLPAKRQVRR